MWRISPAVAVLVVGWSVVSCHYITCPDGKSCTEYHTCCMGLQGDYECCPYFEAVCCSDRVHCCPSGFSCNQTTQYCELTERSWRRVPLLRKVPTEDRSPVQSQTEGPRASMVYCDDYHWCPDGTTCCRGPTGYWSCCAFSLGKCCWDGIHCCPYGSHCDSYLRCVTHGLVYPFTSRQAPASIPASPRAALSLKVKEVPLTVLVKSKASDSRRGVIRCDDKFYCPAETSCCKEPSGQMGCCP